MIYVTGDFHGDYEKFSSKEFKKLKKGDTLLVCGDFGFIWEGSKAEARLLKKIGRKKYKVLFVEGTHDNIKLIRSYPTEELFGGRARKISGNLYQLQRGEIFEIEGKSFFAFGGGETDDAFELIEGENYWREELPSPEELSLARDNLKAHGDAIDYIISHECAGKMRDFLLSQRNLDECNVLQRFFDKLTEEISYKAWFFGRYHLDKIISQKSVAVFNNLIQIK